MIVEIIRRWHWNPIDCRFDPVFIAQFQQSDGESYYGPVTMTQGAVPSLSDLETMLDVVKDTSLTEDHITDMLARAERLSAEAAQLLAKASHQAVEGGTIIALA